MQVAARRLIVVSAISLFGATTGVALGNFAAGGSRGSSGADEIAAYMSMVDTGDAQAEPGQSDRADLAVRPGPSSYHCEGCDASPYNSAIDSVVADLAPLPRYQTEDAPLPPARSAPGIAASGVGVAGSDSARPVQAPPLPE